MSAMSTIKVHVWLGIHKTRKLVYTAETQLKGYTLPSKDTMLVLSLGEKRARLGVNTVETHYSPIGAEDHVRVQCSCHLVDEEWIDKDDEQAFEKFIELFQKDRRWKLDSESSETR